MRNNLFIFFLLLLVSCGKEVKFTNQLETSEAITGAAPIAITQTATLFRSTTNPPGSLQMNGRTYNISPFSSYVALNFINQQPVGSGISVKVRGDVKGTEVYLKLIEL